MMTSEQQRQIEESALSKQLVVQVRSLLPADDGELDRWLADTLERLAHNEFVCVICAAIGSGRRVDPRHLAKGGILLAAAEILPEIVMRMPEGDVPEHLLQAAEVNIPRRHKALMLAVTAVWCRLHRRSVFPRKLTELAREMARQRDEDKSISDWLSVVAVITGDQGLVSIVRQTNPLLARDAEWKKVTLAEGSFEKKLATIPEQSIFDLFGEPEGRLLALGNTMRRSVARVGRNEPCPCGSGKKYKKCCFEKDQDRLRHSTSFEGVTAEELAAAPESHLSADSFADLPWEHIDRIDPRKLPASLLQPYFERLQQMGIVDRFVDEFEKVGYSEALHSTWRRAALSTAAQQRPDLVERLVILRRHAGFTDDDLDDIVRFCLLEDNPADWLAFLEERMDDALSDDDPNALAHLAQATAYSNYPALGVFVCRSVAPLLPPKQASTALEDLLKARDRLGHLPEDPMTDVLDKLLARRSEEADQSEAQRETLLALDAKRRESRELKERIKRTERELERAETEIAENAKKSVTEPGDGEEIRKMHRTLESLKGDLKEVHNERNAYRRKYEQAQEHIDELSQQQRTAPQKAAFDAQDSAEDDLLLPEETSAAQPVRLIDFPRSFDQRLREAPRQVARATMAILGRLASGESAAFAGALRLKAAPTITRVRIGSDWRLLFRLLPERIEVVDLIPRQDLERRIKTLPP